MITLVQLVNFHIIQVNIPYHSDLFEDRLSSVGNSVQVPFKMFKQAAISQEHLPYVFSCLLFSSVQSLSHVLRFATLWTAECQASLSITNSQSLLKHIHRVSDAIQPSHPLLSPSPSAFYLSQHQGLFQRVSSSHQVAKVLFAVST